MYALKKFCCLIVVSICFSSCLSSFRISVREPAVVDLPKDVVNFGIINNLLNDDSTNLQQIGSVISGKPINGNEITQESSNNGLLQSLSNSSILSGEILRIDANLIRNNSGEIFWSTLDSICDDRKLDGVIDVIELNVNEPIGGTVLASAAGRRSSYIDGQMVSNIYLAYSHLSFERLLINERHRINVANGVSVISILNDMQRKRRIYTDLGFNLGFRTAQLIYPNWIWVNRKYFNKGSKSLKWAKPMIREGNWEIAQKQLINDVNHPKMKIRGRTLYNLAIINEGMGNIEIAINNAEAAALSGIKVANDYLRILKNRKINNDLIKFQDGN